MKNLLIGLLTIGSISAYASNPELDAIFKKYEPTLMNFKVGMQSVSTKESNDFEIAEDGTINVKTSLKLITTVILKLEGSKAYEYESSKDLTTGEVETVINFNDYTYISSDQSDVKNIKVLNDVLSADFNGKYEDQYSKHEFKGSFTKNLLSSMFCGSSTNLIGNITDLSTGHTYPMKENVINFCNGFMSISEIKKINLTEVEFCDFTLPEDSERTCEVRDMSYLTSNL